MKKYRLFLHDYTMWNLNEEISLLLIQLKHGNIHMDVSIMVPFFGRLNYGTLFFCQNSIMVPFPQVYGTSYTIYEEAQYKPTFNATFTILNLWFCNESSKFLFCSILSE